MKQLPLFKENAKTEFGGDLIKGRRKSKRPFNPRLPIHLVLRADVTKTNNFRDWETFTQKQITKWSLKFNVIIKEQALVHNHIHLLIEVPTRENYNNFVRALTGTLAAQSKIKWLARPYTRLVRPGADHKNVGQYIIKNQMESWNIIPYTPRQRRPNTCHSPRSPFKVRP